MYLVDTDVVSASAPTKAAHPLLLDWMDRNASLLFMSTVTVVEIESGIAKSRRSGAIRKAAALAQWLEMVLYFYQSRVVDLDLPIARIAGALMGRTLAAGHAPGMPDVAIAATAHHRGLTVLSRNLRHFAPLGVAVLNPFARLPDNR